LSSPARAATTKRRTLRSASSVVAIFALFAAGPVLTGSAAVAADEPAPSGSIGLRLVDAPVNAGKDPRAQIYIVDHLAPGTTIRRRIEITNTTASAVKVALYSSAATIRNGSFLGAAGDTPNDLSTWTSIDTGSINVPARGDAMATVTLKVPRDAAPGEQYGVVWAEASSTSAADGGVTQVSRVGIRIYLSVGPGGPPAANFRIDSLTARRSPDGLPMVVATVHNTGGRALDMYGTLKLSDGPGGLSAGPFPVRLGTTLAVGDTEPVTIALDKQLPDGPWEARISLKSGLLERHVQASITFADVQASPSNIWLYAALAALIALLLALIARLVSTRRRRLRPTRTQGTHRARETTAIR